MTQAGGAATIYGVLYQMLGSLPHVSELTLCASVSKSGDNFESATIILEPKGGGGDLQLEWPNKRRVEQWKSNSDQGTWSLKSLIEEVLPDLFIAVDGEHLDEDCEYVFVTEGRQGQWGNAPAFFASLGSLVSEPDPISFIDDCESIKFFPSQRPALTRRAFFNEVLQIVRRRIEGVSPDVGTHFFAPSGAAENSPAIYCWVDGSNRGESRQGRLILQIWGNSAAPTGLIRHRVRFPAMNCWAIFGRP